MVGKVIEAELHTKEWFDGCFKGLGVPDNLKKASTDLCRSYDIKGISDPAYVANIIATNLELGDGKGVFYNQPPNIDELITRTKACLENHLNEDGKYWGSTPDIEAGNVIYEEAVQILSKEDLEEWNEYSKKATTLELYGWLVNKLGEIKAKQEG